MSNIGSAILAIDTSSRRGSVALAREGQIVSVWGAEARDRQSAVLWADIDLVLTRNGLGIKDLTALAVTTGPGAFTGLRVGLAAAAGLARASRLPLYGATTLEVVAHASGEALYTWTVLNAYRGEVYAQPFRVEASGRCEPLAEPAVAAPDRIADRIEEGPVRIVGSGGEAYAEVFAEAAAARGIAFERAVVPAPLGRGWQLAPGSDLLAPHLARIVTQWIAEGRPTGEVQPTYVRPSEAEINLKLGRIRPEGVRSR